MAAVTAPSFDYVYEVQEADLCNRALARIGADRIRDTAEDTKQARACRAIYATTRDELLRLHPWNFATRSDLVPEDTGYVYETDGHGIVFIVDDERAMTSGAAASGTVVSGIAAAVDLGDELVGRRVSGTGIRAGSTVTAVDATARTITLDRAVSAAASGISVAIPVLRVLQVNADPDAVFVSVGGGSSKRILTDASTDSDDDRSYLEVKYIRQELDPSRFDALFIDALVLRLASKIALTMTQNYAVVSAIESEFSAVMQMARNSMSEERQVDEPGEWWTDRAVGSGPDTRR